MIILTQTYDMLVWLLPRTEKFPLNQRFIITARLQNAVLDFQEALYDANVHEGRSRLSHLTEADAHLNKLRLYLRLARQWGWLSEGQYRHVSEMVANIGKLLGGWIRQTKGRA